MEEKNYTIKDIARLAGVSAGTVDRVLHDRGEVSQVSKIKVRKVLDEINYQPNMFAIGLAAKKKYIFCCLIPAYVENSYWHSVVRGIEKVEEELRVFNISLCFEYYDHYDENSYRQAGKRILNFAPDAVLLAPNFQSVTLELTKELHEMNIPIALVDVNPEGVNALKYVGQDSYQSGYIAAKILMREYAAGKELVLFLSNDKENTSEIQTQRRLKGFMRLINERYGGLKVHEVILNKDGEGNKHALADFFSNHPRVSMGVVFNSRVYQVGNYLKMSNIKMEGLIGYDLLEQNVKLLKEGIVTYLIGQRPELQSYCAVKALADKVVFKKEVEPVKYMPIDILMKDNIDYYFEFA